MALKPTLFRPKLYVPQGLNNHSGAAFRCFSVGETLPFRFTFNSKEDPDLDVSAWQAKVVISSKPDAFVGIEANIPLVNATDRIFEGAIDSALTKTLTPGIHYAVAKFLDNDGSAYPIDMCILEVYPNPAFTA